jgi:hypothetical protein
MNEDRNWGELSQDDKDKAIDDLVTEITTDDEGTLRSTVQRELSTWLGAIAATTLTLYANANLLHSAFVDHSHYQSAIKAHDAMTTLGMYGLGAIGLGGLLAAGRGRFRKFTTQLKEGISLKNVFTEGNAGYTLPVFAAIAALTTMAAISTKQDLRNYQQSLRELPTPQAAAELDPTLRKLKDGRVDYITQAQEVVSKLPAREFSNARQELTKVSFPFSSKPTAVRTAEDALDYVLEVEQGNLLSSYRILSKARNPHLKLAKALLASRCIGKYHTTGIGPTLATMIAKDYGNASSAARTPVNEMWNPPFLSIDNDGRRGSELVIKYGKPLTFDTPRENGEQIAITTLNGQVLHLSWGNITIADTPLKMAPGSSVQPITTTHTMIDQGVSPKWPRILAQYSSDSSYESRYNGSGMVGKFKHASQSPRGSLTEKAIYSASEISGVELGSKELINSLRQLRNKCTQLHVPRPRNNEVFHYSLVLGNDNNIHALYKIGYPNKSSGIIAYRLPAEVQREAKELDVLLNAGVPESELLNSIATLFPTSHISSKISTDDFNGMTRKNYTMTIQEGERKFDYRVSEDSKGLYRLGGILRRGLYKYSQKD